MPDKITVEVDGHQVTISNLDKVLYPLSGTTKAQVIEYYSRIAPTMLPYLADRPVTMRRFPNGVDEDGFFQKRCPSHRPDFVPTLSVPGHRREPGGILEYCGISQPAGLVWAANLAALELHVNLARMPSISNPDWLVFDLDPGPPAGILECAGVALTLKGMLDNLGLQSWVKTSGKAGIHVLVPVVTSSTYDQTKTFAEAVANTLETGLPDKVTATMTKTLRRGRVFIDWSQNTTRKTTVCAYSLRATPSPLVSTPVSWDEVARAHADLNPGLLRFDANAVLERVESHGDLLATALESPQAVPQIG
jgi:bifunctional non-homologous end joining protein LigD